VVAIPSPESYQDQSVRSIVPDDLHQGIQRLVIEIRIEGKRSCGDDDGEGLALQLGMLKLRQL